MLSLRDPADETNDLGRKGTAIKHVQATLRDLHYQLVFDTKVKTRPSILAPLVGSSYMLQLERRRKLQGYGQYLEQEEQRALSQKAKAVRDADRLGESMPEQAVDKGALKKEIEEEETKQRLARELRDREWQRLAEVRKERLRNEAEKTSVLEHGDAMASVPDMPAVEEESQTKDNSVQGQGDDLKV
jgi:non-canonical poly(A) RNA polymerase PAPD5/7